MTDLTKWIILREKNKWKSCKNRKPSESHGNTFCSVTITATDLPNYSLQACRILYARASRNYRMQHLCLASKRRECLRLSGMCKELRSCLEKHQQLWQEGSGPLWGHAEEHARRPAQNCVSNLITLHLKVLETCRNLSLTEKRAPSSEERCHLFS